MAVANGSVQFLLWVLNDGRSDPRIMGSDAIMKNIKIHSHTLLFTAESCLRVFLNFPKENSSDVLKTLVGDDNGLGK